jgi:putative sterol carrier protein
MGHANNIISKLLNVQDKFIDDAQEYIESGKDKVSMLKIVGIDDEVILLKVQNQRIVRASEEDNPTEIFKCTIDTFLDVVSGDIQLREAITKGHFTIENATTRQIDLVECEKWSKAFEKLHSLVTYSLSH